jgi:hypothetical protein
MVDRNWQMVIEIQKFYKEYTYYNRMKDFGLTSWSHTSELFLWNDILSKKVQSLELINWAKG